jgi:hypothetical protein
MWAMIGTCIAMAIWTSGLLWFTKREEDRRVLKPESETGHVDTKGFEAGAVKESSV